MLNLFVVPFDSVLRPGPSCKLIIDRWHEGKLAEEQQSRYLHQYMSYEQTSTAQACGAQVASHTSTKPCHHQIKLAMDVHAASIVVVRMIDGAKPQPPQRFPPKAFLEWVRKQKVLAQEVISCYEAGPTGFWLHRQLTVMGVRNYVVCPTRLDERYRGVVNDQTDATELATRLDRYLAGNPRALAVVRVPTEEQEQKRTHKRQRQQLRQQRLSLAAQGRSLMLLHGRRESNYWWHPARWERLEPELPGWLVERLKVFRQLILEVDRVVKQLTQELQSRAPKVRPLGMGGLTHEAISYEVADWNRFKNWRQVGSYAGLTGGVSESGQSSADLSITKAGNKRLRTELVELSWRLLRFQPGYYVVQKWNKILLNPKAHRRARKRAIIAFARQLFIDLWRWQTGRRTPEQLGWIMTAA
jgi:transposase